MLDAVIGFYVNPALGAIGCTAGAAAAAEVVACWEKDSYTLSLGLALLMGLCCFVASLLTGNDSWVDRLWSIVPAVYAWIWALWPNRLSRSGEGTSRPSLHRTDVFGGHLRTSVLFALLVSLWGVRLTFNFWRKGGYRPGGEDYRWEVIRKHRVFKAPVLGRLLWVVFSFVVISVWQQILLWIITTPLSLIPSTALVSAVDVGVAVAFLSFLLFETVADQQQWNFQNEKRKLFPQRPGAQSDYQRGFPTRGLWARSRKPNVWAEMQIWLVVYFMSLAHAGGMNVTCLGFVVLASLLIPAAHFTESISSAKYPDYAIYKRHVPMFVPSLSSPQPALQEAFERQGRERKRQ